MVVTHRFVAEERPDLPPATNRNEIFAAWALAALLSATIVLDLVADCVMPAATAGHEISSVDRAAKALPPDDPRLRWNRALFTNPSVPSSEEERSPDARGGYP